MKVFTIWLIDKIRFIAGILFIAVAAANAEVNESVTTVSFLSAIISIARLPLGTGILLYLIPTGCSVFLALEAHEITTMVLTHVPALALAISSAVFLYRNFDIVTSRHFRYHNSRLSEWQLQWLYSIRNSANVYLTCLAVIYMVMYFHVPESSL